MSSCITIPRVLASVLGVGVAGAVGLLGVLAWWSPGAPRPVTGRDGRPANQGLAEKIRIPVNGTEQGLFLRASDPTKPVLLFVHGGPGMPEYFLDRTHPTGLEQDFVVAWWEQRGAGLSYRAGADAETMSPQQLVDDTIAVADYLRDRFGQDKVYLLAHSWGTFIGIQAAAQAPDRFAAYIGMGQVSRQRLAETLAYQHALEEYARRGDDTTVNRLRAVPVATSPTLPSEWIGMRDDIIHRIGGGTTRDMDSVITGVFLPVWQTPDYTIIEKLDIGWGKKHSQALLFDELIRADLATAVPGLEIPTYFIVGRHDYTVSWPLARDYFTQLDAPVKGFYTFEESAHSPAFEEPGRMRFILCNDVLNGTASLADAE